jgi:sec-independent protein translocase protein TatC
MSTQEMSFWDHLEELRWTLFRIIIALIVFAVGAFLIMPWFFDNIIMGPAKSDFFLYSSLCNLSQKYTFLPSFCGNMDSNVDMINIELTAQFFRHISTSGWVALVLICPYILFEVWKFVKPALYEHERKSIRWVFLFGSVMFFIGCLVGYSVIFPMTFHFLYNYQLSESIPNIISLDSYLSIFLTMILVMGFVFEMPLISWLLSQIGILKRSFFKNYRRHAIVILLIAAAMITPSGDPFTLTLVFIPLYSLYELSIFLVKKDPPEEDDVLAEQG